MDVSARDDREMAAAAQETIRREREREGHIRTMMMPDEWYSKLDEGIRFPVRVLHAAGGIETCQSCQGGEGHAYHDPTIDVVAASDDAKGFRALDALVDYNIEVASVALVWPVSNGMPAEKLWRITLKKAYWSRSEERPIFVHGYMALAL